MKLDGFQHAESFAASSLEVQSYGVITDIPTRLPTTAASSLTSIRNTCLSKRNTCLGTLSVTLLSNTTQAFLHVVKLTSRLFHSIANVQVAIFSIARSTANVAEDHPYLPT